jgi:hypothetical protein
MSDTRKVQHYSKSSRKTRLTKESDKSENDLKRNFNDAKKKIDLHDDKYYNDSRYSKYTGKKNRKSRSLSRSKSPTKKNNNDIRKSRIFSEDKSMSHNRVKKTDDKYLKNRSRSESSSSKSSVSNKKKKNSSALKSKLLTFIPLIHPIVKKC